MPARVIAVTCVMAGMLLGASTAAAGTSEADQRLDRVIHELIAATSGPPAVAVVVQRDGQRKLHSFGVADRAKPGSGPIGLRDHIRIASVSKAFSGAIAMALVKRRKMRLDETIGDLLPALAPAWNAVTLRELLQHTSGVPSYTSDPEFLQYFGSHLQDYISPEQAISYVTDEPLEFAPGSRYEYSNTDNIVIALMAHRATGTPYEVLLRKLVTKPLRLRQTTLPNGFLLPSPFVHGYVYAGAGEPLEDASEVVSVSSVWASGAVISTVADLNRFIRAWGGGTMLSRKLRQAQTRFVPNAPGDPPGPGQNSGGLTLFRYRLPCGVVLGHTGNFPGYTAFAASSRDGTRSAVVLANLQLDVGVGAPDVFPVLHKLFQRAACAAFSGSR